MTGRYNFHEIRNNAVVFVREGGKLDTFDSCPYYFVYYPGSWVIQGSENYKNNDNSFWVKIDTKGQYWLNVKLINVLIFFYQKRIIFPWIQIGKWQGRTVIPNGERHYWIYLPMKMNSKKSRRANELKANTAWFNFTAFDDFTIKNFNLKLKKLILYWCLTQVLFRQVIMNVFKILTCKKDC